MGCDIHAFVETWDGQQWNFFQEPVFRGWAGVPTCDPFDVRSYGLFGFLADGLRYNCGVSLGPLRGLPLNLSPEVQAKMDEWKGDLHSHTWATGKELVSFDYNTLVYSYYDDGGKITLREFLGDWVDQFKEIAALTPDPSHVRVVYAFDS